MIEGEPDSLGQLGARHRSEIVLQGTIIQIVCDGDLPFAKGDQSLRSCINLAQRPMKGGQIRDLAAQVVLLRSPIRCLQAADEDLGHIFDVLKILDAAIADVVAASQGQRLDRLGRIAGHAEVPPDTVHSPRT